VWVGFLVLAIGIGGLGVSGPWTTLTQLTTGAGLLLVAGALIIRARLSDQEAGEALSSKQT